MPRVLVAGDRAEQPVRRHRVLGEVVRADRGEVGLAEDPVGQERGGGHFDHDTRRPQAQLAGEGGEVGGLLDRGHHGGHDPQVGLALGVGLGEGGELLAEDVLARPQRTESAQAQGGVLLVGVVEEREGLVGAGVEHADDDLLARERREQLPVRLALLRHGRGLRRGQEEELGAEEADALGAASDGVGRVRGLSQVGQQGDRRAVGEGAGRGGRGRRRPAVGDPLRGAFLLVLPRVGHDGAGGGVDDHRRPGGEVAGLGGADDGDDALLAREDRGVRGRPALECHQGQDLLQVQQRRVGRGEIAGDEDERMPRIGDAGRREPAELGEDALRDVVKVGGALAEVAADGLEGRPEAGERVVHGPLGGGAVVDPRVHLVLQRRILGDHRLRLQHVPRRAAGLLAAALELSGDRGDRGADATALLVGTDRAGRALRGRRRLGHPDDGALRDPLPDADAPQRPHAASSSWSVARNSARTSSARSAPSPSAERVT